MKKIKTLTINGSAYQLMDGEAARIEDSTAGENAWSSKNIVDRLCPAFTESGTVVSCQPVQGYPLKVVSRIDPVQSGSGDPSPDNIRPITGWTGVQLSCNGKNLMDNRNVFLYGATNIAGIPNKLKPGQTYTITLYNITNTFSLWLSEERGTGYRAILSAIEDGVPKTFTAPDWVNDRQSLVLVGAIGSNAGTDSIDSFYGQIELGSASTEYEPYRGTEISADLGQVVYGGIYDWDTGILTVDTAMVELDENSDIKAVNAYYQASGYPATASMNIPNQARQTQLCNCARIANVYNETDYGDHMAWVYTQPAVGEGVVRISAPVYEAIKAGTKFQITYKLAQPYAIQLTTQEIHALSGENVFYSDTGGTTVTGRADLAAIIEKLTNAILALGGNV